MTAVLHKPSTRAAETLATIERFGFTATFDPAYELALVDLTRRVQVRDDEHYAPKDAVAQFAAAMEAGAEFPPLVVTADEFLVSGNTRTAAAKSIGRESFPALVMALGYRDATAEQERDLTLLAGVLNASHGTALTQKERKTLVLAAIQAGWPSKKIQREFGVSGSMVSKLAKDENLEKRLVAVGLDPDELLAGMPITSLYGKDLQSLNNEPFRMITELAAEHSLTAPEINKLAGEVKALGVETEQIAALEREAMRWAAKKVEEKTDVEEKEPEIKIEETKVEEPAPLTLTTLSFLTALDVSEIVDALASITKAKRRAVLHHAIQALTEALAITEEK